MLSRVCIPHGCGGGVESEHTSCNLKSVSLGIVSHRFRPITCSCLTGYMIVRFCSCRRDTVVTNCQSEFTTVALSLNFFLQMSESRTTLFPRSVPFSHFDKIWSVIRRHLQNCLHFSPEESMRHRDCSWLWPCLCYLTEEFCVLSNLDICQAFSLMEDRGRIVESHYINTPLTPSQL